MFFPRGRQTPENVPADAFGEVGQLHAPTVARAAAPAAEIAVLEVKRDAVLAELGRLGKVDTARSAAEAALAQLAHEEKAIDQDEAEAARAWALDPDRDLPAPLAARRQELAQRRVVASANLASALNAGRAVDEIRARLNSELRDVGNSIFEEHMRQLAEEARDINTTANELAAELVESAQQFDAIRLAMMHLRGDAVNTKNEMRAEALTSVIDRIEGLKRPALVGDPVALDRQIAAIKQQLVA